MDLKLEATISLWTLNNISNDPNEMLMFLIEYVGISPEEAQAIGNYLKERYEHNDFYNGEVV